jgi:hypothetical protein
MKNLLSLLTILSVLSLYSQDTIRLKLDNYCPRVDDKIELTFSFDFFNDIISEQLAEEIKTVEPSAFSTDASNVFTRNISFSKSGKKTVGPFRFEFNDKAYVTDAIVVEVGEKLPYKEGVWVSMGIGADGEKVIVLEQYAKTKTTTTKTKNGFSSATASSLEGDDYAKIWKINDPDLNIRFKSSHRSNRSEDDDIFSAGGMMYAISIYVVEFEEDFSGTFLLKKKHYKNLPSGSKIQTIEITR